MHRGCRPSAPHGHLDGLVIVADDPRRRGLRGKLAQEPLPAPAILGATEPEPPQLASAAIGAIPMGREDDEGVASAPTTRDPIGRRPPTHLERIQHHDGWPAVGQQRLRDDVGELVDVVGRESQRRDADANGHPLHRLPCAAAETPTGASADRGPGEPDRAWRLWMTRPEVPIPPRELTWTRAPSVASFAGVPRDHSSHDREDHEQEAAQRERSAPG
jgi:hypothetical protein